jgi:hypothetical protein
MVRDRSGGLHGNVSSHSYRTLARGSSLAIARTSRINLLLKDYPVLIPGLVPPRGAWRSAFGVRARTRRPRIRPGGVLGNRIPGQVLSVFVP